MGEKHYPCLYVDSDQLPELEGVEVGDEFTVTFKVKVKAVDVRETDEGKKSNYDLELHEGKVNGKVAPEEKQSQSDIEDMSSKKKNPMSDLMGGNYDATDQED